MKMEAETALIRGSERTSEELEAFVTATKNCKGADVVSIYLSMYSIGVQEALKSLETL